MEITEKPYWVSFAGNPMRYLLESEQGGGGGIDPIDGVMSEIEISFTGVDTTLDHAVEVTMLGKTRTFTLKGEPSTKDHLPVADESWDAERWCLEIFGYILNDREITENYDLSYDTTKILLKAKTADPDYDWTEGTKTITGVTITTTTDGVLPDEGEVEGVLCRVLKNGFTKLGEDYKPLSSDGSVRFDIQEYIYAELLKLLPPRFQLSGEQFYHNRYDDFFLKYRTVFVNRVDGEYEERSYTDGDHLFFYAIAGGLNREDLVANNNAAVDYFDLAATQKKFLTWMPPTRITDKDETHSLYFAFQEPEYTQFQMKAHLYNDDTGETIVITPKMTVGYWEVVEFMGGYTQLGLADEMSGTVKAWELYLVDGDGNVISDVRRFELDDKEYDTVRYFRFRNSWGTYDSLRCTGVFETNVEHEREKVTFMGDDVETDYNAPGVHSMIKESLNFKANTGWMTKDYLTYLRDFMLSSDILEIDEGRFLKCLLTSKKTTLYKDLKFNYSLAFEYERGWDDFFFHGLD